MIERGRGRPINDLVVKDSGHLTTKLNKEKLHTDTYMRTYTKGQNKTKQSKRTQDCESNSEDMIRPSNSDVSAQP